MINSLSFSTDYNYVVELHDKSGILLGSGTLKFGGGKLIRVHMDVYPRFSVPEDESTLNATAASGDVFTLIGCELEDNTIYANLVICGKVEVGVSSIIVKYADISEWFMHGQQVESKPGESVIWGSPPPPVNAEILTNPDNFNIKSDIHYSTTYKTERRIIHESVNFTFSKTNKIFGFPEIKEKPLQLACLLSILIAYPISISNIWVAEKSGRWLPVYFPAFEQPKKELEKNQLLRNSLIRRKTLDSRWADLFNLYFNSPYIDTIWVRLAGMQRYKGFWEYRVLGYVTLLDSYADAISVRDKLKTTRVRKSERDEIGQKIAKLDPPLTPDQLKKIERILAQTLPDKGTDPNFKERYEHLIKETDPDVTRIINITPDEFAIIKGARDAIAHNNASDLEKYPYSKLYPLTGKITLLLTFRALTEFGISAEDFIRSLGNTINGLRYIEGLSVTSLERILNPETFFKVSRDLFEKVSHFGTERMHPFFTLDSSGDLQYSGKHASLYNDWIRDGARRSISFAETLGIDKQSIRIVSKMHVEFDGRIEVLIGAHIISV
ncbi:HEPN domain-containing protein [Pseudomonas viridiflava]|uniref:ApeA N-terminal domain 1-containing protein n=1 Tax=Pseudomonas viridiflava TaxID=33069 RepID=UPI000F03E346|nr:HEPN domain-containing protein [Pseudomonas viridiflava]